MDLRDILERARSEIRAHSDGDADKFFYANRFVFARLKLDEQKSKVNVKKRLINSGAVCYYCMETFDSSKNIHLHRFNSDCGYSDANCVLMHPDCHTKFHSENPTPSAGRNRTRKIASVSDKAILTKESKRYEGKPFLYWWDITPDLAERLKDYDTVEFLKKDTGESCLVPPAALVGYFTKDRQTSRGQGNWGIRVLKEFQDQLAFDPGTGKVDLLFFPVIWRNREEG